MEQGIQMYSHFIDQFSVMFFILNCLEENGKMKLNANKTGLGNSYAPVLHY